MLIPIGYAQINLRFEVTDWPRNAEVVYGVELNEPGDTPADVAEKAWDLAVDHLLSVATVNHKLVMARAKFGPNATGPYAERTGIEAGTVNQSPTPPQVTMLISKTTDQGGRAGRGRMYLPLVPGNQVNSAGLISGTAISGFQSAINTWLAGHLSADIPVVLLHNAGSSDTTPDIVQRMDVQSRTATQRRRNRG